MRLSDAAYFAGSANISGRVAAIHRYFTAQATALHDATAALNKRDGE